MNNIVKTGRSLIRYLLPMSLLVFFTTTVWAGLPAVPDVTHLTLQSSARPTAGQNIGKVELAVGDVRIVPQDHSGAYSAFTGTELRAGDIVFTGDKGRCRLQLLGEDIVQAGSHALLQLGQEKSVWNLTVWDGAITLYGLPSLLGRKKPHTVQIPGGMFAFSTGKLGIISDGRQSGKSRLLLFNTSLKTTLDTGSTTQFSEGQQVQIGPEGIGATAQIPITLEPQMTRSSSPEEPAMALALQQFKNNSQDNAQTTFSHIQAAYPFNAMASYYLGLIALQKEDLGTAISQWRRFEKLDPAGATQKDIPKQLTVLISRQMKKEVQQALANEKQLTDSAPEPNSVAVPPFANRGGTKFEILSKGITAMVIADLAKVPGLKVLERAKLQKLMEEIKLSQSGMVNDETAAKAGRLLRAEKLVIGDYSVE
ncbi:MAG: hypothetical protein HQL54_13290 [Magnetococcales bacterium]|nr:hypothetical protein [Magnetococcales bacterium]